MGTPKQANAPAKSKPIRGTGEISQRKEGKVVKKVGGEAASVSFKELGTNCWLTKRFIEGTRCERVMECTYLEKKTCKAVDAEIAYLHQERREAEERFHAKISKLVAEREA